MRHSRNYFDLHSGYTAVVFGFLLLAGVQAGLAQKPATNVAAGSSQAAIAVSPAAQVCAHDPDTDAGYLKAMLHKDTDGWLFVDYLRVVADELDNPEDYPGYLSKHRALINRRLKEFIEPSRVREKYEWLSRYHDKTLKEMARR